MMASLFLSRVLGIVRDMVAAALFGQNIHTDAYRIAFQVPDLIFFLVAGGALSSAFIPVFSEYIHTDRREDAWKVFSTVLCVMSAALVVLIGAAWVFAPQLAAVLCGDKQAIVNEVAMMSRIVLPAQFAFFIGGLIMGTFYVMRVFTVPGLGPNVYNIGIIAGAALLGQVVEPGVAGMSWGALVGAIVGNLVIPILALPKIGVQFRPSFDTSHPGVRKVFRLMLPVVLGLSLPGVYALILQYFSTFYPEGSNSAVDAANRLMQAPLAIFGQSLALAAFPVLSQFWAQNNTDGFGDQLGKSLRTVLYLTLPVSAVMIAMPAPIVKALLEHGAFTPADTARTAAVLQTFAFGVAAWCLHPLLMRAYFSMQRNVRPIVMGTLATLVFLGIGLWIVDRRAPVELFGVAGSVSATLLVLAMIIDVRKVSDKVGVGSLLATFVKSGIAAGVAGATAYFAGNWLMTSVQVKPLFISLLVLLGVCCLWVYYFATKALAMPEAATIERAMRRKRG